MKKEQSRANVLSDMVTELLDLTERSMGVTARWIVGVLCLMAGCFGVMLGGFAVLVALPVLSSFAVSMWAMEQGLVFGLAVSVVCSLIGLVIASLLARSFYWFVAPLGARSAKLKLEKEAASGSVELSLVFFLTSSVPFILFTNIGLVEGVRELWPEVRQYVGLQVFAAFSVVGCFCYLGYLAVRGYHRKMMAALLPG